MLHNMKSNKSAADEQEKTPKECLNREKKEGYEY